MTRTQHGHHIRGTKMDEGSEPLQHKCGGPSMCNQCAEDVIEHVQATAIAAGHIQPGDFKTSFSSDEEGQDFSMRARRAVALYVNSSAGIEEPGQPAITVNDTYVVWFVKVLQHWKALVSTTLPDGMYYEVTHNGDKEELYLDAYHKLDNVVLPMRTRKV